APIDVTENKEYRLTQETLDFLGEMNADVEAIAFYSTQDASGREEAELWLGNYARASNGRLTYRFVDPDRNPTEAQQYGVTRTGTIVFVQGDRNAQAIYPDERNMTSALVQVFIGDARQVFYLTGHGERDFDGFTPDGFSSAKDILTRGVFQLEPLNLAATGLTVPESAELLIIAGPVTQFSAAEVEAVKAYLDAGGKVLFLADPGSNAGALGSGVLGVDFNPEGRGFATSGNDGTARTWSSGGNPDITLRGHTGAVFDVAYSPDGETLATISIDGTVRVWNADSGEEVRQLEGHSSGTGRLAFSPDGNLLASVGEDQLVRVWDTSSWEPVSYSPLAATVPLYDVAFSPDGSTIAAVGGATSTANVSEGWINLWDSERGSEIASERLHSAVAFAAAFSPDGSELHSVALDGTEGIYNLEDSQGSTQSPYEGSILSFAFVPDGRRVYGLADGTIHVRPAGSANAADDVVLEGHTGFVTALAVSPDGETLVSASSAQDGTVRIWSLESGQQTGIVESAHSATDPLTEYFTSEWGITVNNDLVVDLAVVDQSRDEFSPAIFNYMSDSPISAPMIQSGRLVSMLLAHSLTLEQTAAPAAILINPLMTTSDMSGNPDSPSSWGETSDPFTGGQVQYDAGIDIPGPLTVGYSAEDTVAGGRVVIIGDADFASNREMQNANYGNSDLLLNAANWLVENENAIALPQPDVTQRTMTSPLSGVELPVLAILVACILPAAVVAVGALVWWQRKRQR
ncbi:MAG: Gldg family protein, partial [Anaerolineae bacterium]|nr:Gldg family protein [Anaerolineae bacterium]